MDNLLVIIIIILELSPFTSGLSENLNQAQKGKITVSKNIGSKENLVEVKSFSPMPYKNPSYYTYSTNTKSVMIVDMGTSETLYAKNELTSTQIASLTKLMTAKLLLDSDVLSKTITITPADLSRVRTSDAVMGLSVGDEVSYELLLKAVLVESASDAALAIANHLYEGGYDTFVSKMNEEAKTIGLTRTMYENPVGWDHIKNYSTPKELNLLTRMILKYPEFRKIITLQSDSVATTNGKVFTLKNTNLLLDNSSIFGVKTGTTNMAGECLITLAKVRGNDVLITVLDSPDRYTETKNVLNWLEIVYNW